jgi:hypothetical protein
MYTKDRDLLHARIASTAARLYLYLCDYRDGLGVKGQFLTGNKQGEIDMTLHDEWDKLIVEHVINMDWMDKLKAYEQSLES